MKTEESKRSVVVFLHEPGKPLLQQQKIGVFGVKESETKMLTFNDGTVFDVIPKSEYDRLLKPKSRTRKSTRPQVVENYYLTPETLVPIQTHWS